MLLCNKIKIVIIKIIFLRKIDAHTLPTRWYEDRAAKTLEPRSVQTLNPALPVSLATAHKYGSPLCCALLHRLLLM